MTTGRRRRRRTVGRAAFVTLLVSLAARPVAAHQFASRFDAPVPVEFVAGGAAVAVGVTAAILATGAETPTVRRRVVEVPGAVGRSVSLAARAAFLLAFVWVLVAGLTGPRAAARNFATLFTWVVWLKGVALASVLAGSPWRVLSPWRTLYDALCHLAGGEIRLRSYPETLGHWPALAWFLVLVGITENLTRIPQRPTATAVVVGVYALVSLVCALFFGREWFERGDVFEVLYGLLGRSAPFSVTTRDDGGWTAELRAPWRDCSTPLSTRTLTAFAVAMVYTVTFDGFAESSVYWDIYAGVREAFGAGPEVSVVLYEAGLFGFLVAYLAVAVAVARLVRAARGQSGRDATVSATGAEPDGGRLDAATVAFGGTILPVAAAYEVAHNYGFVATYLGRLPTLSGFESFDPLWWLSVPLFWLSQVAFVVAGHVVAVVAAVAAVRRLLTARRPASGDRFEETRALTKRWTVLAQAPLVALMVGYTALSLWVVSLPVAG
ncbi:hypothetical protein SAMN04488063_0625 [Halopelagius inordinatus]|uniref:Uncharacterized protein n=1 Tax=Halopelagius inordinatus TaxID=553467 RepID=A0A1I2M899_9EURY|nr:hypothetical protein [Halopelagius inordinatus]SFF87745.1 hypothetical protein SAMN04488063_0625 [Halopelagius inordinatus]